MTRTDDTPVPDYPGLLRLDGRRFVVLGAGQGIGRQASHALASVGARLACVDQDADLAGDIAGEIDGAALSGNAFDRADMERMFDEAGRALGGIDGVVDIIGMSRYGDLVDMSDDDWTDAWEDIPYLSVGVMSRSCSDDLDPTPFDQTFAGLPSRGSVDLLEVVLGDAVVMIDNDLDPDDVATIVRSLRPTTSAELADAIPAWVRTWADQGWAAVATSDS